MKAQAPPPPFLKTLAVLLFGLGPVFFTGLPLGGEVRPAIIPDRPGEAVAIPAREMGRGPQGLRQVALTFDAGWDVEGFGELLQVLDREGVRATFFLTGQWVQRHPREAQMLVRRHHAIGNHSWAHPEYTGLSDEAMKLDLLAADALLSRLFGRPVKPLFRPPFGDRDKRVLRILGQCGYLSVYWSIDTLDAMEPRKTPEFISRRVTDRTDAQLDGAIILCHAGYPETCAALPGIIANLRARGFHFVTINDWLEP